MIRSMTGFGRAGFELDGALFEVEVRSVNHRHLDLRVRVPRPLSEFEGEARATLAARFERGKVDASVQVAGGSSVGEELRIDLEVAARYVEAAAVLRERHGLAGPPAAGEVLALPGVARFVEHNFPREALSQALRDSLVQAADRADAMRCAEGEALERELRGRLARVAELSTELEARAGSVQEQARERLRKRAEKLARETGLHDEARLHQEIVIAADRMDVTEEIVRLRSHVEQFASALAATGPRRAVGRRLDFLLQEMGREANTLGAKGGDAEVAHLVVELKTELERVREQVQNVE